jgi:hypothetical protein
MFSKALETLNVKEKQAFPLNQTFTLKNSLMKNFAKDSISEDFKLKSRNDSSYSNKKPSQYLFKSKNEFLEKENFKQHQQGPQILNGRSLIDLENQRRPFNFRLNTPNNANMFSNDA